MKSGQVKTGQNRLGKPRQVGTGQEKLRQVVTDRDMSRQVETGQVSETKKLLAELT